LALARDGAGTRDSTRGSMQHRFVIIGYGTMGFTHIKKLTALGTEIAGIVDIDPIARDEATGAGLHV
jgi:Trk K+ transport system NAD-binding subunit